MQALLHFLVLIIRCAPAFLRSHNEQAIVELALRQQLATYKPEEDETQDHATRSRLLGRPPPVLASMEASPRYSRTRHRGSLA